VPRSPTRRRQGDKKPIYTARARVTGGRVGGRGRTGDGTLDARLRLPKALGGAGDGANPEQLFAIGYAGCFEAAMTVAAQRLGVPRAQVTDVAIEAKVMLLARDDRRFELGVELVVELPSLTDQALAAEVVRATHQLCPYSNPIRGERRRRADGQRRRRKAGWRPCPHDADQPTTARGSRRLVGVTALLRAPDY
jgi:osmotically inducible protein OsmC